MSKRQVAVPGLKVLIISSEGSQAKFMLDFLTEAGYEAWTVELGENALEVIWRVLPNLVILDYGLRNAEGLKITRLIRAQDRAHLPLLVMGTDLHEEDVLAFLEAGADLCLTERLHPKVFLARLHAMLRR